MIYQGTFHSPLGEIIIREEDSKIIWLGFLVDAINEEKGKEKSSASTEDKDSIISLDTELIGEAKSQLQEYFEGKRYDFNLPLKMKGPDFQIKVWEELSRIPYGKTCTYEEIAINIGCNKGQRAVGMANNKNSIAIVVPCHRVIGKSGKLVGYAAGLEYKKYLLDLEAKHRK